MIDIRVVRLPGWWRLTRYVAFAINDYDEIVYIAAGRTHGKAYGRCWRLAYEEVNNV